MELIKIQLEIAAYKTKLNKKKRNKNTKMYGLWTEKNLTSPKPNSKFNLKQTQNWENWITAKKRRKTFCTILWYAIYLRANITPKSIHTRLSIQRNPLKVCTLLFSDFVENLYVSIISSYCHFNGLFVSISFFSLFFALALTSKREKSKYRKCKSIVCHCFFLVLHFAERKLLFRKQTEKNSFELIYKRPWYK